MLSTAPCALLAMLTFSHATAPAPLWSTWPAPLATAMAARSPDRADATPGGRPSRTVVQLLRATSVDVEELALLGRSFDVPEITRFEEPVRIDSPGLMVLGTAIAADGARLGLGAQPLEGDVIASGLLVNGSDRSVVVIVQHEFAVEIVPNAMVVIGSFYIQPRGDELALLTGGCCAITCGSGYYACCNPAQGGAPCTCRCVKNANNSPCQSGGQGATGCSIGP